MGYGDKATAFELLQGFSNRRAANAIGIHQVAFGGEMRAGCKFPFFNADHQPVKNLVIELSTLDGVCIHGATAPHQFFMRHACCFST